MMRPSVFAVLRLMMSSNLDAVMGPCRNLNEKWLSPEWLVNGVPVFASRAPSNTDGSTAVKHYAAIDISLELSSVCIIDAAGKVVKEAKVETHPGALVKFFKDLRLPLTLIGFEAGPLSQWLHAGLTAARFETVLMETRHVKKALSASTVKTDRRDARGMAQLLRMG